MTDRDAETNARPPHLLDSIRKRAKKRETVPVPIGVGPEHPLLVHMNRLEKDRDQLLALFDAIPLSGFPELARRLRTAVAIHLKSLPFSDREAMLDAATALENVVGFDPVFDDAPKPDAAQAFLRVGNEIRTIYRKGSNVWAPLTTDWRIAAKVDVGPLSAQDGPLAGGSILSEEARDLADVPTSKRLKVVMAESAPAIGDEFRVVGIGWANGVPMNVELAKVVKLAVDDTLDAGALDIIENLIAVAPNGEAKRQGERFVRGWAHKVRPTPSEEYGTPIKRWPFVESPGDFAKRLRANLNGFGLASDDVLAAVRTVLIENPPVLADWALDVLTASRPPTVPELLEVVDVGQIEREWALGNITRLGAANLFRRLRFIGQLAIDRANALPKRGDEDESRKIKDDADIARIYGNGLRDALATVKYNTHAAAAIRALIADHDERPAPFAARDDDRAELETLRNVLAWTKDDPETRGGKYRALLAERDELNAKLEDLGGVLYVKENEIETLGATIAHLKAEAASDVANADAREIAAAKAIGFLRGVAEDIAVPPGRKAFAAEIIAELTSAFGLSIVGDTDEERGAASPITVADLIEFAKQIKYVNELKCLAIHLENFARLL